MKKRIALVCALILLLPLVSGCFFVSVPDPIPGTKEETPAPAEEPTAEATPEPTAEPTPEVTPEPTEEPEAAPTPDPDRDPDPAPAEDPEPEEVTAAEPWCEEYRSYILSLYECAPDFMFQFTDLNGDGVPEMIFLCEIAVSGGGVCTVTDHGLYDIPMTSDDVLYTDAAAGRICLIQGKMDDYTDTVCIVGENGFEEVFRQAYTDPDTKDPIPAEVFDMENAVRFDLYADDVMTRTDALMWLEQMPEE